MSKMNRIYPMQQTLTYNPPMKEVPGVAAPSIQSSAFIGSHAILVGDVRIDDDVFVGFYSVMRADSSYPFYVGQKSNIQDYVLMHCHPGQGFEVGGETMGIYVERFVTILPHAAIQGPAMIGENTLIGQHASIFGARIGRNCVIMHGAVVTGQVGVPDGRYVKAGETVDTQEIANALPPVPNEYRTFNEELVDHYYRLGRAYRQHTNLFV